MAAPAPRPLLVATTNAGKLREIRRILSGTGLEVRSLADIAPIPEPEETGLTFGDNARLKALAYYAESGLPTVAEDSGLVIDAIGGRPGVESARYPGATYADKFARLYRELAPHPRPWTARFVCALAFVPGGDTPIAWPTVTFETEATIEGEIAEAPHGSGGFGYDPIFFYPPYGCTMGDVSEEQKLAVAHRGKAFRTFRDWLRGSRY
jgi:XTP/dITP diphosphohydrolase